MKEFDLTSYERVSKRTRAGSNGKKIVCPLCCESARVYHFCWTAITCQTCKHMIEKKYWFVKAKAPNRKSVGDNNKKREND